MNSSNALLAFIALLLSFTVSNAQKKEIPLDADLIANAKVHKVKAKTGALVKYRFGDYKIEKGKMGWEKSSGVSKLWSREAQFLSEQKFSFTMRQKDSETAMVSALLLTSSSYTKPITLFDSEKFSLTVGGDSGKAVELFSAAINTSLSPDEDWVLRIESAEDESQYAAEVATLENGDRTIILKHVNSEYNEKSEWSFPALGYEFWENGKSLGAVMYFSGGISDKKVWFRNSLDKESEFVMATAFAAILVFKEP